MGHKVGALLIITIVITMIIQSTPATAQMAGERFVGVWNSTSGPGFNYGVGQATGSFRQAEIAYSNGRYLLHLWDAQGVDMGGNWLIINSELEATTQIDWPRMGAYGSLVLLLSSQNPYLSIHMAFYCTDKRLCASDFSSTTVFLRA